MVFASKLKKHHAKIEKHLPFLYAEYGYQLVEGLETDSSLYYILGSPNMRMYLDYEIYDSKRTRLGFYVDDPRGGERPPIRLDIFDIAVYSDDPADPAEYVQLRQRVFKLKFEPALDAYAPLLQDFCTDLLQGDQSRVAAILASPRKPY